MASLNLPSILERRKLGSHTLPTLQLEALNTRPAILNRKKTSQPDRSFPLFELPGEIRTMIYEHVLAPTGLVGFKMDGSYCIPFTQVSTRHNRCLHDPVHLSFLLTCRKIFDEAEHIFYEKNEFVAVVGEDDWFVNNKKKASRLRRIAVEFVPALLERTFRPVWHDDKSIVLLRKAWHAIEALDSLSRADGMLKSLTVHLPARFEVRYFIYEYREELLEFGTQTDTNFVDYFLRYDDSTIMYNMFPFFCGFPADAPPEALFPHAKGKGMCDYRVVCNHASWDDEQVGEGTASRCCVERPNLLDGLFPWKNSHESPGVLTCSLNLGDQFPKAVLAVVHNYFGGELWHNGKLIWKDGHLKDRAFARDTPFDNSLLRLVRAEAFGEGKEFPWSEEIV